MKLEEERAKYTPQGQCDEAASRIYYIRHEVNVNHAKYMW